MITLKANYLYEYALAKKQKSDQSRSPQKCYCLLPICVLVNAIKEIRSQSFNFTTTTFSLASFKRALLSIRMFPHESI